MGRTGIRAVALACVLLLGALTAGCAQAVGAGGREAAAQFGGVKAGLSLTAFIKALRSGITQAESAFPVTPQQWVDVPASGLTAPRSLLSTLKSPAPSGLSAAEKALVQEAKDWAAVYKAADEAVEYVTDVSIGLPDDAIELVMLARFRSGGPAFDDYVDAMAARLLKKQTCLLARESIDAATAAYADEADSGAFSDLLDSFIIQIEMDRELAAAWQNSEGYVDTDALGDAILEQAKQYAAPYVDVLDSPNGGIFVANVAYLRTCVAR